MLRSIAGSSIRVGIVAMLVAFCSSAFAEKPAGADAPATIKQTLLSRMLELTIVDVRPAQIPGIYEVYTGRSMLYTDKSGKYLFYGLVDTATKRSVADDRVNKRNSIDFKSLPFDRAIKIVKGDGSRQLAMFTDPDCPYCRKLEEELKSVDNLTVYVFLFPLTKIHPNAERHAKAIWCAGDRAAAWTSWMLESKEPADATCDGDPVTELAALAAKLNIAGTPTVYFANGRRSYGGSAADMEKALAESTVVKTGRANGASGGNKGAGGGGSTLTAGCKAPSSAAGAQTEACGP